jgi:hypothetical protein
MVYEVIRATYLVFKTLRMIFNSDPILTPDNASYGCGQFQQSYDTVQQNSVSTLPGSRQQTKPFLCVNYQLGSRPLERRKPEAVAAVLHAEHAQQEAVHAQQDSAPEDDGELLGARVADAGHLDGKRDGSKGEDAVDGGNDLRLETELVAEAAGEVADTALTIARHIGRLADVVEHVAAREEQHGDQTEGGPQVAVLQHGDNVGPGNGEERHTAEYSCCDGHDLDVVDGARDLGPGCVARDEAGDPGVDLLGRLGAVVCQTCNGGLGDS